MKHVSTKKKTLIIFRLALIILLAGFAMLKSQAQTNVTLTPGQTWTVPPGVTTATFYLWGGGGAGAGSNSSPACYNNGGGGGGGACASATVVTLVPGTVYTFSGGTGGASVATTGVAGGNGVTTSFSGPAGTWTAAGGAGAGATLTGGSQNNPGGLGGTGGTGPGVTVRAGGDGSNAANGGAVANGCPQANRTGSGGGGGGSLGIGGTPINGCPGVGGAGGTGTFPGGNGGYNLSCGIAQVDAPGVAGAAFGGGGSGCMNWGGGAFLGGAGGDGRVIVSFGAPACSGTPTPGNTIASISVGCSGDPLSLSLQNLTNGTGVTYQWQSSPTGSGYLPIAGATASTYSTALTVTTFYQCVVTCAGGGSGTSTPVQVVSNGSGLPQTFAQTTFPPCNWTNANTGCLRDNVSAFGIGNGSAKFDFYTASANMNLTSPTFTAVPSGSTLTFDFAYSAYDDGLSCNDFVDELRIRVSSDGGATYTAIDGFVGGTSPELNPFGLCNANPYTPTAGQWSSKSVSLPAGTNRIQLRGLSGLGNNLYLDNINLNVPTPCSGAPSPGNTSASTNNQCMGTDVILSLPTLPNSTGFTYAWQTSPDNIAAYTNIAGATNVNLTIQPSTNGWYRCRVTCSNSGQAANSTPIQITVVPCIIMVDGLTTNACSGTFYDGGGPSGNYGNNNDRTTTICPSSVGSSLKVTFSAFDTETGWDPLHIYNGPTNTSPIFNSGNGVSNTGFPAGGFWGTANPGGAAGLISTDPSGCLTFRFRSDGSVVNPGWVATLSCIAPCSGTPTAGTTTVSAGSPFCASESFTLNVPNATVGGGITYQWQTSPDNSTWTNVGGATAVTYTTTQSVSTYYRCIVKCTGSNLSAPSTGLQVLSNPDFTNCYCTAIPTDIIDEEIYRFFVNGVGTPTAYSGGTNGCNTPAPGPGSVLNRYSNFKTLGPLNNLLVGAPSTFQVNENECDGAPFYSFGTAIWIDYNHNGSFADAGEKVFVENTTAQGSRQITGTFIVPATALPGITALRVIVAESFSGASLTPCLAYDYGETEDWLVNIIPPNATSNSPVCEKDTIKLFAPTTGVSYSWTTTASNGFTSSLQNPIITASDASDAGLYTVVVNTGSGSYSASVTVVVNPSPALSASASAPFCAGTQNLNLNATAPTGISYLWTGPGGYSSTSEDPVRNSTIPSMSGTYNVKVTDANGCTNTATTSVTVYALPTIALVPQGSTHLCTGQFLGLLGDGAGLTGTYLWSTAETGDNITIASGGTYSVTGTDLHGCINTDQIVITESAPPTAPIIVAMGDVNICSSDGGGSWTSVTLHTTNYTSGLAWNTAIDFGQDLFANYPGDFNVTYTDALFCSSTSNTISTIPNLASTAPVNTQVSSDAPGNITCAVPVTLTLAEADGLDPFADAFLGSGAQWVWYDDAGCGVNSVGTGTSVVITPSAIPGPHNYYVRAEGICNNTNCAFITITVKEPSLDPVSGSASSPSICEGDQVVLSVTGGYLGTGASWKLYENTCGSAVLQTSSTPSFTVTPQTPGLHTYYIRGEGDCNNTNCSMIQVDVKDLSSQAVSFTSSSSVICEGDPLTLNINGGHLGRGAVWSIYEGGCGNGIPLQSSTSTSLAVTPQPGLHTYYVRAEGDCNNTLCMSVSVDVKDSSETATSSLASPAVICEGGQTVLSVSGGHLGTGASWMLYENTCGGVALQTSSTPSFTLTPAAGLHTYFIRAEGDCNNTVCSMIQVDVKDLSSQAVSFTSTASVICEGDPLTLNINGGHLGRGAVWSIYEGGCGNGIPLQSSTSTSLAVTPQPGLHTYYVRAEGDCNNTLCMSVSVDVKDSSEMATSSQASPAVICEGSQTVVSVSGGHLGTGASWMLYENTCGGAALQTSSSPSFTIAPTSPGLHTYFIRAEGDCNNTICSMIQVDVKDSSSQAVSLLSSASDICEGSSVTLNISGGHLGRGAVWSWYEGGCGNGAPLQSSTSTSLILTPLTPGLHTYYVRAAGDCNTTLCRSVSVNVKVFSVDPTSASASVSSLCSGDQTILSVSGGSLGTGAQWKWYSGTCGGTLVGIGASVTVNTAVTTTYFVRAEGDCNNTLCQSTTVSVNTLSTDPTTATSNAPVNGICIGGSVILSVSGGSLGTGSVWKWYEDGCGNGLSIGTGSSITVTPAFDGLHSYYVRAEGPCNTTNCAAVSVLVGTYSVEATGITSSIAGNSICTGNNITLTVNGGFLGTVAQWKWYSGSCGGTLVATGVTSITVNPAVTTTYYVRAEGSCNNTLCASIVVSVTNVAPTNPPPTITTAPNGICSGNGSTVICQSVPGATFYSWSAPNGTTFNGNNPSPYITTTNTVQVTFGNLPNGVSGYDICVFAGNGCGNTVTKCRYIRGRVQSAQTITGNASSCPNTNSVYSIVSLPGADSYTWTVTGAATINGGGTTLTTTATSVTVNFLPGWTSGTLSVYGSMSCGYNAPTKTITIISTPVVPGVITGQTVVCPSGTYNYSIAPVAGALTYNWSTNVPGAVIGAGTTSRSITFPAVIPAGSTVSVTATGSCGTSTPRVKNIATGLSNTPGTITGPAMGQCGQTGVGYSILPVAGATSYFWSATNGANVSGLNNITSASLNFPAVFTTSVVSVIAINGCGNSAPQTKLVTGAPGSPGAISGTGAVCLNSVETYSVVGATGATSYNWTNPPGSIIMGGQGLSSVSIMFTDNLGGNVSVTASNACGSSTASNLAVSVVCRLAQISQGSLIDATLYPNPTIGTTTLRFETITAGDYKVSVVDMTGQVMQTKSVTAVAGLNLNELDLRTYAKGLYMVRLEREGEAMQMLRVTVE